MGSDVERSAPIAIDVQGGRPIRIAARSEIRAHSHFDYPMVIASFLCTGNVSPGAIRYRSDQVTPSEYPPASASAARAIIAGAARGVNVAHRGEACRLALTGRDAYGSEVWISLREAERCAPPVDRSRHLQVGQRQSRAAGGVRCAAGQIVRGDWPRLSLGQLPPSKQQNGAHGGVCAPQPSPAGDHYLSGSQIAPPAARSRQTQGPAPALPG